MDYDQEFKRLYDYISETINMGHCNEIVFEDIDRVLGIIWESEDSTSGLFESLESESDRKDFLLDFRSATEWLMGWNRDDLTDEDLSSLAKDIITERS